MFFILKYAPKFLCLDTLFLGNLALYPPTKFVKEVKLPNLLQVDTIYSRFLDL